jgi:tetratricopeptide (TPR) repeat protein
MLKSKFIRVLLPLVFTGLTLLAMGCSQNSNVQIRYKAEKLLHSAEKLYETATIKPDLNNRELWAQIKQSYNNVAEFVLKYIDSLPANTQFIERAELESIAFMAVNRLSSIYYSERNFDSAIVLIHRLLAATQLEGIQLLTSELNLARILQSKGNWTEAMKVFRSIIDTFYPPVDNDNQIISQALNLPLELIRVNRMIGDTLALAGEIESAHQYYQRLITEWPNSALSTAAISNLARLYFDEGNWDKAIENLALLKDSTGQVDLSAAIMIADITSNGKKEHSRALSMYDQLLTRMTDSATIAAVYSRKGRTYFDGKDYPKCRETMSYIKDYYYKFFQSNPIPQTYIALSLARGEKWNLAENEFLWLIDNYSTTEQAFEAFLIIANHYGQIGEMDNSENWLRKGVEFYDRMARQYTGTAIEASAISYKAEVSRREEDWVNAAKYLEELFEKFPQTDAGRKALINAAAIYREKLQDPQKADKLIDRVKKELMPIGESKNIDSYSDDK